MKKKILFLTPWYPNRYDPMPGLFVKRHAELLTDVCIITVLHVCASPEKIKKFESVVSCKHNLTEILVYYNPIHYKIPLVSQIHKFWRYYHAHFIGFKEVKQQMGLPDMVHVNILTRVGLFAWYIKIRFRVPYVITEHWSRYLPERNQFKGYFHKKITRFVVRNCQAVSAVTQNLKQAMLNCGLTHPQCSVINNVVDFDIFKPKDIANPPKVKIFANITCFDDQAKNGSGIIRSLYELAKQRSDFICLMVGDGTDRLKTEALAEKLGINRNYVIFTGILEGDALIHVYNQSLFTFLFSNYENLPVVIPESFACGKPVLATRVGGIHECITEQNGILISPGNQGELIEKLNFMLDHAGDYQPTLIRNSAYERFSPEAVRKQLMDLYRQAIPV